MACMVECKPSSLRASPLGFMLSDVYSIYQRNTKMASSELLYFTERGWGPPLLLVHGLMFTGEMFEPVVEHFATRHRVIVPDLRGHGRSRGLAPPYTAAHLAADLSRLLDHLGIDSTAVLDYSHGGAIAQQLVLDHPTRCNRLVLACTYAFNMATFRERFEGHLLPLLLDVAGMRRFAKFVVSLVTARSALSLVLVVGSPALCSPAAPRALSTNVEITRTKNGSMTNRTSTRLRFFWPAMITLGQRSSLNRKSHRC